MKGISTLLIVFGFLAIAAQATYLRVIHAVPPGDMKMDVYYTAKDTGEKIRLFQDLNYTNIPPYFFIPVLQDNEQVELSFLLKPSENSSEQLVSQQQLRGLPSHTITLGKNLTYSLVVTSSSQQNVSQDQSQGSEGQEPSQNQTLEYLLLNDFNQEEVPADFKLVRLINLAEDASPISLIDEMGDCPQEMGAEANQTSQDEESQGQVMEPLVQDLAFLEASDYIDLPQQTQPLNLFVCHLGEKIPVTPAPLFRASGSRFSILLFTGASQMNQSQDQGTEDQETQDQGTEDQGTEDQGTEDQGTEDQGTQDQGTEDQGTEDQGSEDQGTQGQDEGTQDEGSQDQGMEQNQGQSQFIAYVVSDEPVTTQNVRIRVVHAESSLPAVNVMLDGEPIFQSVSFGNVTEYSMTVRGIHNISVSLQSQGSSMNASSIRIVTFFAWMKSYTIAVVRTSSGQMGVEYQDESGQGQGNQGDITRGEPSQMAGIIFPGFQGNLHKIFVDEISKNTSLGSSYAYVQFVHLASNVGAVNVNVGNQNITNIRFLQSSQYRGVLATSQQTPIEVLLASSNTPVFSLETTLQPGTLYTLWALQDQNSTAPLIFLTEDRQVQIQCVVMDVDMMGNQGQNQEQ